MYCSSQLDKTGQNKTRRETFGKSSTTSGSWQTDVLSLKMTDLFHFGDMWSTAWGGRNGQAALKRQGHERESPPKDLPTKTNKQQRMQERQQLSGPLNYDPQHNDRCRNSTSKCAGTQTPFSSFSHDPLPYPAPLHQPQLSYTTPVTTHSQTQPMDTGHEERYILDLDKVHSRSPGSNQLPSGGATSHQASFPLSNHSRALAADAESDTTNMPLNLTVSSSSSTSSSGSGSQLRPSVITCATSTASSRSSNPATSNNVFSSPGGAHHGPPPDYTDSRAHNKREVSSVEACDPVIEEHFRRSLGPYYAGSRSCGTNAQVVASPGVVPSVQSLPNPPQGAMTNGTSKQDQAVSVTGSVDDHFAKSLGAAWTKIKDGYEPVNGEPDSVDDHFAKALGQQTWDRIKTEKELNGRSSTSPVSRSPPSARSPTSTRSPSSISSSVHT